MTRSQAIVVGVSVFALVGLYVGSSVTAEAGPPTGLTTSPLVLRAVSAPSQVIPAVTAGTTEHAYYTVTADGPFCLEGFRVDSYISEIPDDWGQLMFALSRIDGYGQSYDSIVLETTSGGSSPQDVVITYGAQICASESLTFHAVSYAPSSGTGAEFHLSGKAIVLAASNVTVTITPEGE